MMQRLIAAGALCAAIAACGSGRRTVSRDSAGGEVLSGSAIAKTGAAAPVGKDSALSYTAANVSAASPLVHVTMTDGRSVSLATKYRITDASLRKYMAISDSLSVLAARDPAVKRIADSPNLTGAGSRVADAGLKLLESNAAITRTITDQGLSVPDFFVMSIAIASAERFLNDPSAAPPTPSLAKNATLLEHHPTDRLRLHALSSGPMVTSTP